MFGKFAFLRGSVGPGRPLRGALCLLACIAATAARSQPSRQSAGLDTALANREPITVGTYNDAYPYSYVGADGRLAGFSVEIMDAVARAVNLKIEHVAGSSAEIRRRFQNGEFSMLQYHSTLRQKQGYADYSVPFLSLQGCVFVKANSPLQTLRDLDGQTFGMIGRGQSEKLLEDYHIAALVTEADTPEELILRLETGKVAAVFMTPLGELAVARKFHFGDIRMLGKPLNGYEVTQAFAAHAGDAGLIERLNEGLAIIHGSGEYDRIYRKSFGQFGSYILSVGELESYASLVLGIAFIIALWGYIRQRYLRKELSVQASLLAEQGAILQALHDNIPVAMTVMEIGPAGKRIISMNRQASTLYSVDEGAPLGPLDSAPVSEDVRRHLREACAETPDDGRGVSRETQLSNGKLTLEVTAVPLSTEGLPVKRVCLLVEDVTVRLQQDAEVARSRKLRAVGELVGGIAHEFNNLLTPVMLKAGEIQLSRPGDRVLQQDVEVIIQAVQRTAELTRRLLTFGRKTDHRAEAVSIATIAAGCFDLLRHTVDRRITWENSVPPNLAPLHFNATDLNQILLNLLLNARDALLERLEGANPDGWKPVIVVSAAQLPPEAFDIAPTHRGKTLLGWQRVTVRDNGLGMEPAVVDRIFEPFFTTKEVGKGTGLGLATVWHLVNDAGGRIDVESTPGVGSEFHVLLPVWPTHAQAALAEVPTEAAAPSRILLIEDEALVASSIVELLRRNGHEVLHLDNGAEAWVHLQDNLGAYDLLIIDVNLPGLSGIDIVERARESSFSGRIFMVSGRFTSSDMSAMTRLKIDHSLAKPFNVRQFMEAVNECLEPSRP